MLSKERLCWMYKIMYTSRLLDDTEIKLKKQGHPVLFQVNGCGHEAIDVAIAAALEPRDWVFPYYRNKALLLGLGYEPFVMLLDALGKPHEKNSRGRQMPAHWYTERVFPCASPTGVQFLPAVGCAQASEYFRRHKKLAEGRDYTPGEVTLVTTGDGATNQGDFWEAVNAACLYNLP